MTSRLTVTCDGNELTCGFVERPEARGTVVLLHGIPSVAPPDPDDEGYPGLARRVAERGWNAAWADLRGVRGSKGMFSIEGWVRDVAAVVDATRAVEGVAGLPLAVVGSSDGGAVATEAVARGTRVDALALLAAPAAWVSFAVDPAAAVRRIRDEAGMPLAEDVIAAPDAWAAEFDRVVTEDAIARVAAPVLVVHGTADDVVPVSHATRIAERARIAELHILEGAGHRLRQEAAALRVLFDWLERTLG